MTTADLSLLHATKHHHEHDSEGAGETIRSPQPMWFLAVMPLTLGALVLAILYMASNYHPY